MHFSRTVHKTLSRWEITEKVEVTKKKVNNSCCVHFSGTLFVVRFFSFFSKGNIHITVDNRVEFLLLCVVRRSPIFLIINLFWFVLPIGLYACVVPFYNLSFFLWILSGNKMAENPSALIRSFTSTSEERHALQIACYNTMMFVLVGRFISR